MAHCLFQVQANSYRFEISMDLCLCLLKYVYTYTFLFRTEMVRNYLKFQKSKLNFRCFKNIVEFWKILGSLEGEGYSSFPGEWKKQIPNSPNLMFSSLQLHGNTNYRTPAIISRGLYLFYHILHFVNKRSMALHFSTYNTHDLLLVKLHFGNKRSMVLVFTTSNTHDLSIVKLFLLFLIFY